jgi:murein L,D-transpeptidase YcbB/YkuD
MKKALAELRAKGDGEVPILIADGGLVRAGASDPRIPAVRQKLIERGYAGAALQPGADPLLLDKELSAQLRQFQKAARIKVSGVLGPQTVAALNAGLSRNKEAMLLNNMERLRWLPRDLGNRHIFVNPPAYAAEVVENGRAVWSTRVIVGKPNTQTYMFHDEMELVVFNPSWGVPPSIIAREYLPKLRRDPGYLDRLGFKVVNQQGKVVPSRSVRWASYGSKVPFGIHQPPGAKNALGEVKFLFPNTHNIYMHDTPARELFEEDARALSHGCVRVQNPREFASVILGWDAARVDGHIETPRSETVRLKEKIPVHLAYFTAWPDESGAMRYFEDIYGRDKAMENARSTVTVAQR